MESLLLTKVEAGKELRCSVRTVERLIASGDLSPVKVGGATRIRREDLTAYVNGLSGSFRNHIQGKAS